MRIVSIPWFDAGQSHFDFIVVERSTANQARPNLNLRRRTGIENHIRSAIIRIVVS